MRVSTEINAKHETGAWGGCRGNATSEIIFSLVRWFSKFTQSKNPVGIFCFFVCFFFCFFFVFFFCFLPHCTAYMISMPQPGIEPRSQQWEPGILTIRSPGNTLMFCCSVTKSRQTPFNPVDCSTPGFPVLHCLCSNSCPLSRWCHPTIASSVAPFSSCVLSFPASGSFPMS